MTFRQTDYDRIRMPEDELRWGDPVWAFTLDGWKAATMTGRVPFNGTVCVRVEEPVRAWALPEWQLLPRQLGDAVPTEAPSQP